MRTLEEKFGRPHPELEQYRPLARELEWLQAAYFRLHRRRQISEIGLQPLSHQEIVHFAERVMHLKGEFSDAFIRIIEHVDNGVLYDSYKSRK